MAAKKTNSTKQEVITADTPEAPGPTQAEPTPIPATAGTTVQKGPSPNVGPEPEVTHTSHTMVILNPRIWDPGQPILKTVPADFDVEADIALAEEEKQAFIKRREESANA